MHFTIVTGEVEQHQNRLEMMQLLDDPSHSTLDRIMNESDPLSLVKGKSDDEVFNLKKVMAQDDRNHFVKATEKETQDHL